MSGMHIGQWLTEAAAWLSDAEAGVHIVTDPRDVRVPGGVIYPATIVADRLDSTSYSVDWRVILLAPGPLAQASDELGRLASHVDNVTAGLTWEATTITDPNISADPIPALSTTITLDCEDN